MHLHQKNNIDHSNLGEKWLHKQISNPSPLKKGSAFVASSIIYLFQSWIVFKFSQIFRNKNHDSIFIFAFYLCVNVCMYVQLRLTVFFCLVKGNNSSEDVIYFKFRFWPSLLTKGVKNERENAYRLLFSRRLPLTRSQSTRALCWILCATCNGNCPSPSPWSHHTPQIESTKDGSAAAISVVFHLGKNEWYPVPNNSSESSGALKSRQSVSPV